MENGRMAMGKREGEHQSEIWIPRAEMPAAPGHPFYRELNRLLAERGFDRFVECLCRKFYADGVGRPSIPPGVYFRMLLIGYFEGIDSERGIAWRCADSRTLAGFLGYGPTEATPDHSSLSVIRRRIDVETHREVFAWVLKAVAEAGLLRGKTLGIDATTLEANAAMRSIVRRDTGASYAEFLEGLAKESGIETPTREDLAKLDRKRKKRTSNKDWYNPNDPDAKVSQMKDGRTHLAHKAEHAVDLETGAVVGVTLQPADRGDTSSLFPTAAEAAENVREIADDEKASGGTGGPRIEEVVADKGYHSNETCRDLRGVDIRTYISEPARKRRDWQGKADEQAAVYANRRRIRGRRGKALLRKRGELLERTFAHCYETGGMRRTHLRGHPNILKRLLIHVAGFNLGLVMRRLFGIGKPRRLQDGLTAGVLACFGLVVGLLRALAALRGRWQPFRQIPGIRTQLRRADAAA